MRQADRRLAMFPGSFHRCRLLCHVMISPTVGFALLLTAMSFGSPGVSRGQAPATANGVKQETTRSEQSLAPGDHGPAVEDLQRRLNAGLEPSPELDIDGEYGDATRAAVVRFQRSRGLGLTGIADPRTRRA